jgi:uncharacterized membrane protein (UPF0127 family)
MTVERRPTLVNARTGEVVASSVEVADTRAARRRGLLGREGLPGGAALVITRSNAVHTIGMRFAIDVVFVDAQGTVRKIVRRLPPWRVAVSVPARSAIEFGAGEVDGDAVRLGDRLYLAPPDHA